MPDAGVCDTVAWELWEARQYTPPNLWTVVEAVRRVHQRARRAGGRANLDTDFESVFPDACPNWPTTSSMR